MKGAMETLRRGFAGPGVPQIDRMFNQMAHIYGAFALTRFNSASRGDGTWKPLAAATIYQRARASISRVYRAFRAGELSIGERDKKLKYAQGVYRQHMKAIYGVAPRWARQRHSPFKRPPVSGNISILADTGTLRNALNIGQAGNISERVGPEFEYGIGGPAIHNTDALTIGKLAAYHHNGGTIPGRPPVRTILVSPPNDVRGKMRHVAARAVAELLKGGASV
jgi:hypothetical protein